MGDIRWQFKFHFKQERDEMIATGFSTLIKIMAKAQWYILLIGWVQRVYEQVPAFSDVFQKTF